MNSNKNNDLFNRCLKYGSVFIVLVGIFAANVSRAANYSTNIGADNQYWFGTIWGSGTSGAGTVSGSTAGIGNSDYIHVQQSGTLWLSSGAGLVNTVQAGGSGNGGLYIDGAGTLVIDSINVGTNRKLNMGATTGVNLSIANGVIVQMGTGAYIGANGGAGGVNLVGGGVLDVSKMAAGFDGRMNLNDITVIAGPSSFAGSVALNTGTSQLRLTGGTYSLTLASAAAGTSIVGGNTATTVTLNNVAGTANSNTPFTNASNIEDGGASLKMIYNITGTATPGTTVLTLSGSSNYSGGTDLNLSSGTTARVTASNVNALGTGLVNVKQNGVQLWLNGTAGSVFTNAITLTGTGNLEGTGALRVNSGNTAAGAISLMTDSKISSATSSTTAPGIISGAITGNYNVTFGAQGYGSSIQLTGANGYKNTTIGDTSGNSYVEVAGTAGSLGTGDVTFGNNGSELVFNRSNAYTYAGNISGGGKVTQKGGTTTLTGVLSHTGATTVQGGTLLIDGAITASTITVNSGATLGGVGTVKDIALSGILSPGDAAGQVGSLTVGNVTMSAGSSIVMDILSSTSYDQLSFTSLSGFSSSMLTLNIASMSLGEGTYTFDLFSGGTGSLGDLSSRVSWGNFYNSSTMDISNNTFDNGTLTFTLTAQAVPEPSTYVLIGVGIGLVCMMRMMRRKSV